MSARFDRWRRALEVTLVARRKRLLRVLGEVGLVGDRPATPEGAREFRSALVALGVVLFALTIVINVLARWVVGRAERRMQGA